MGASHPRMVYPLPTAAIAPLARARSTARSGGGNPLTSAEVSYRLALALALDDAQGSQNRVRDLHSEAKAACDGIKTKNPLCAEVVTWIAR